MPIDIMGISDNGLYVNQEPRIMLENMDRCFLTTYIWDVIQKRMQQKSDIQV
jgi:hypothetical protein